MLPAHCSSLLLIHTSSSLICLFFNLLLSVFFFTISDPLSSEVRIRLVNTVVIDNRDHPGTYMVQLTVQQWVVDCTHSIHPNHLLGWG